MVTTDEKTIEELEAMVASTLDAEDRVEVLVSLAERLHRSNMSRSIELSSEALELARANNNGYGEIKSLSTMGMACSVAGYYGRALDLYQQALHLCDKYGNRNEEAYIHGNLASLYNNLGESEKVLSYIEKALTYHIKEKNYKPIHVNYTNLGVHYSNKNDLDNAMLCYNNALHYCDLSNHLPSRAIILANRGTIYARKGDLETALDHFKEAYEINKRLNQKPQYSRDLINIARVYFEWKDYNRAFEYAAQATEAVEGSGSKLAQMQVFHALSEMYETARKWEDYAKVFKRFHMLEKEVKSEEAQKRGATLEIQRQLDMKEAERHATEKILHNILPRSIAERIKTGDEEIIERFENCTVLFADIVGFTVWSAKMEVKELARHLNRLFQLFDSLANQYGVEKIKTIGDAYMCVAGLPEHCADHAERIANMALAMNREIKNAYPSDDIRLRIGIHSGEVIAGVLGKNKYAYDLWGDTVNTASRMESHGIENKIQLSDSTYSLLKNNFEFEERGEIDVKGKGKMKTWFLIK
ncbi:MAG: adenylate/guanylate cyclase domain-containing protein [Chitinophagales bacterium]